MMPIQCVTCQHYIIPRPEDEKVRCRAFPDGIPDKIYTGEEQHDRVVRGQTGDFIWKEKTK